MPFFIADKLRPNAVEWDELELSNLELDAKELEFDSTLDIFRPRTDYNQFLTWPSHKYQIVAC